MPKTWLGITYINALCSTGEVDIRKGSADVRRRLDRALRTHPIPHALGAR